MATFTTDKTLPWFEYARDLYREKHPGAVCSGTSDLGWSGRVKIYLDVLHKYTYDGDDIAREKLAFAYIRLGGFVDEPTVACLKYERITEDHIRSIMVMVFGT